VLTPVIAYYPSPPHASRSRMALAKSIKTRLLRHGGGICFRSRGTLASYTPYTPFLRSRARQQAANGLKMYGHDSTSQSGLPYCLSAHPNAPKPLLGLSLLLDDNVRLLADWGIVSKRFWPSSAFPKRTVHSIQELSNILVLDPRLVGDGSCGLRDLLDIVTLDDDLVLDVGERNLGSLEHLAVTDDLLSHWEC
jgi:hypothetical protein